MSGSSSVPARARRPRSLALAALVSLMLGLTGCIQDVLVLEPDLTDATVDAPDAGPPPAPDLAAPAAPQVDVSPASLDFTTVGEVLMLRVGNLGDAPLQIRGLQLEGDTEFTVLYAGQSALALEPGGPSLAPSEIAELTIVAEAGPPAAATLLVLTNDPERPRIEVPLGFPNVPCLEADPVDMGEVAPGGLIGGVAEITNCGDQPMVVTDLQIEGDEAFQLGVYAVPLAIPAGEMRRVALTFNPLIEAPLRATLIARTDVGLELRVPVVGRGRAPQCPVAQADVSEFVVLAGDVVLLDGTPSVDPDGPDGRPLVYEWVVTRRPGGSVNQPVESFYDPVAPQNGGPEDDLSTPVALFFIDMPGQYTVELRVEDSDGCRATSEVQIVARLSDEPGLVAELNWNTPGGVELEPGQGADLDLHLMHPLGERWFSIPLDCYYRNVQPDWGLEGDPTDNPLLESDAIGSGPERLLLPILEDTDVLGAPYRLAVHNQGFREVGAGRLVADLTVRLGGVIVYETGLFFAEEDVVFEAISIEWPSRRVTPVEQYAPRDGPQDP